MEVPTNQRHVSCCAFVIYIVFATLAAVVPAQTDNESLVDSSPSPWPYYLQVYPGADPSEETSVGIKSLYFALMMSFGGDFRTSGTIPGEHFTAYPDFSHLGFLLVGFLTTFIILLLHG